MAKPEGDCDDFTMLACSLLLALGVAPSIIAICCDGNARGRFSHVYAEVATAAGRWPVDASHGKYFGWEVPIAETYRRQGWDTNGRLLYDELPVVGARPRGVGDFNETGATSMIVRAPGLPGPTVLRVRPRAAVRRWRRRGVGDWMDDYVPASSPGVDPNATTLDFPWFSGLPTASGSAAGSTVADHSTRDALLGLFKSVLPMVQQKFAPLNPGEYVQDSAGNVRARLVPGAVPTPNTGLNLTTGGMSGTTLLLLAIAAGGAVWAMSRSRG